MKKLLPIIVSLFCLNSIFSQNIQGYLGMRHSIGFNVHFMPASNFIGSYIESNYGNKKQTASDGNKTFWNNRNELFYTYNLTRTSTIKFVYSSFRTGFSYRFPNPNESYGNGVLLPFSLKGKSLGVEFQFYFNRDLPAPIGLYYTLGMNITSSKLVDEGDILYGENGLLNEIYGISFSDPGYKVIEPFITTGFGKKYVVAKDKLLLNVGFKFGFAPAAILTLIPEPEEKVTGTYSSYNPVYYNDEPKGFGEIDDKAFLGAKQRTRGLLSTDFYLGFSWLF